MKWLLMTPVIIIALGYVALAFVSNAASKLKG